MATCISHLVVTTISASCPPEFAANVFVFLSLLVVSRRRTSPSLSHVFSKELYEIDFVQVQPICHMKPGKCRLNFSGLREPLENNSF